jgi:ATP-dependent Clp protease protease subunit
MLEKKNTLVFRSVVTDDSVKDLQQQLVAMSNILSKNETIYLFLNTPGGSVSAGMHMIAHIKAIPQEVKTITAFAASMGFITVQDLGERLILPNGVLMAHRARGGVEGQIPGELNARAKFHTDAIVQIEQSVSARMGISHDAYAKLVLNEYWVEGQLAVDAHAADRVVLVNCSNSLNEEVTQIVNTQFGPAEVVWSACPMILAPLRINLERMRISGPFGESSAELELAKKTLYEAITNKQSFLENATIRDNYLRFVK